MVLKNVNLKQFSVQSPHHNALRESQMGSKHRPYDPKLVDEVCDRIAEGETLRAICREEHMPSPQVIYRWMAADPSFKERFAQARELGEEVIVQECLDIADNATNDWMEKLDKNAQPIGWVLNGEHVQRSKLRIETRLKLLAKWNPRKWGDRQIIAGDAEAPLVTTGDTPLMSAIKNIEMSLQARNADEDSK
jgi:hypothetical protein